MRTKSDLHRGSPQASPDPPQRDVVVSSVTGEGIAELQRRVMAAASAQSGGTPRSDAAINARQQSAIETALREVRAFVEAWHTGDLPTPVVGTHLRAAGTALEELVGPWTRTTCWRECSRHSASASDRQAVRAASLTTVSSRAEARNARDRPRSATAASIIRAPR